MNESSCNRQLTVRSRREFLAKSSFGFGSLALSYLLGRDLAGAATIPDNYLNPLAVKPPHFPAKAKRVIFIFLLSRRVEVASRWLFAVVPINWVLGTSRIGFLEQLARSWRQPAHCRSKASTSRAASRLMI